MRRGKGLYRSVLASLALAALVTACGGGDNSGGQTANNTPSSAGTTTTGNGGTSGGVTTIKIGSDLPVTGPDAASGKPAENGVKLAIDQANAKKAIPGYTIEFVPKDDVGASGKHDPSTGANNVKSLIGDPLVVGIIGPFNSSVAKAEMPIANPAPIALISPSNTNPTLTQPNAFGKANPDLKTLRPTDKVTYFRVCTTDNIQGPVGADYAAKKLHKTKVYILDDTETYGKGIADAFEQQFKADGGTVLGHDGVPGTTKDFTAQLTKIKSFNPDVIYYGGVNANGAPLIRKQMAQLGMSGITFVGGDGIQDDDFIKVAGDTGKGSFATVASVDATKIDAAKQFIQDYKAAFGKEIGPYSANAFEATNILITATKAAIDGGAKPSNDPDGAAKFRQAVIDQIQKIKFDGIIGHTEFDENGDTTNRIITIWSDEGKEWKIVDQLTFTK